MKPQQVGTSDDGPILELGPYRFRPERFQVDGFTLIYEPPGGPLAGKMSPTITRPFEDLTGPPVCPHSPEWENQV